MPRVSVLAVLVTLAVLKVLKVLEEPNALLTTDWA